MTCFADICYTVRTIACTFRFSLYQGRSDSRNLWKHLIQRTTRESTIWRHACKSERQREPLLARLHFQVYFHPRIKTRVPLTLNSFISLRLLVLLFSHLFDFSAEFIRVSWFLPSLAKKSARFIFHLGQTKTLINTGGSILLHAVWRFTNGRF